jgi:hypothetical protein
MVGYCDNVYFCFAGCADDLSGLAGLTVDVEIDLEPAIACRFGCGEPL